MTDRVSGIVEAVRHRLEDELRQQLQALTLDHQRELEQVRQAADQEAQAAETRWAEMLAGARSEWQQQVETAVTAARHEFEAERESERRAAGADVDATTEFVADLDRCTSLTDVLNLMAGAVASRPGGALFVVSGETVRPWPQPGGSAHGLPPGWETLVDPVVRDRQAQRGNETAAVPLMIDGVVIGVLVSPVAGAHDVTPELIAAAGSARLTALTASRLVQAERWTRPAGAGRSAPTTVVDTRASESGDADDPSLSARRYARLLISEIKLYNEAAVREGRMHRDLAHRLGSEITRARQIYEARVPPDVRRRADHFQEELVRTLADGDASLLA